MLLEECFVEQQGMACLALVLQAEYEVPEVDPRDPLPRELPGRPHARAAWDRHAGARALVRRKRAAQSALHRER